MSGPLASRFPPPNRAVRLIFEYKGNEVRLASSQQVDMMTPESDATWEYAGQSGFWVELQDDEGRVAYRHTLHNPMPAQIEVPSGDPEKPFTNVKAANVEGVFVVLVPIVPGASRLALFASPQTRLAEAARELVSLDLLKLLGRKER